MPHLTLLLFVACVDTRIGCCQKAVLLHHEYLLLLRSNRILDRLFFSRPAVSYLRRLPPLTTVRPEQQENESRKASS